mmetsp:Transcript_75484/g.190910  ORF Transcript_75484/g.190910 Transcript_75484/m.190910 type:complete len:311 (+) Transcript_75484:475-1407(+)
MPGAHVGQIGERGPRAESLVEGVPEQREADGPERESHDHHGEDEGGAELDRLGHNFHHGHLLQPLDGHLSPPAARPPIFFFFFFDDDLLCGEAVLRGSALRRRRSRRRSRNRQVAGLRRDRGAAWQPAVTRPHLCRRPAIPSFASAATASSIERGRAEAAEAAVAPLGGRHLRSVGGVLRGASVSICDGQGVEVVCGGHVRTHRPPEVWGDVRLHDQWSVPLRVVFEPSVLRQMRDDVAPLLVLVVHHETELPPRLLGHREHVPLPRRHDDDDAEHGQRELRQVRGGHHLRQALDGLVEALLPAEANEDA